jgi:hypothetical protein
MPDNVTSWTPRPKGYLVKEVEAYKRPEVSTLALLLAAVGWLFIAASVFVFLSENATIGFASAVSGLLLLGFSAVIRRSSEIEIHLRRLPVTVAPAAEAPEPGPLTR